MQSVAIISSDSEKRMQEALRRLDDVHVSSFDRTFIQREELPTKTGTPKLKQSLGIEDIKHMQKSLGYKAFQGETKAIIIEEAHTLTTEAQNALLKVLEEPPPNTLFILLSDSSEVLLPTVRSRCTLLMLDTVSDTKSMNEATVSQVETMTEWGIGKSLVQAEKFAKNKDEAVTYLEECILVFRTKLIAEILSEHPHELQVQAYRKLLDRFEQTRKDIASTNVNLRLALENLFLQ